MTALQKIGNRYDRPDHPFWKHVGNYAVIVGVPVGTVLIETFIPEPWKKIVLVSFNTVMSLIKLGTKFTVDPSIGVGK